jgi:hypothetical protein
VGKPEEDYHSIIVETYRESGSGLHGDIHVRCIESQRFPSTLRVRFPRKIRFGHPIGTKFRVLGKLSDKDGSNPFIHTNHAWGCEVLES